MNSWRMRLMLAAVAGLLVTGSYGVCYVVGSCTCAMVGSCYSLRLPPYCQVPTCIIAETGATVWSACSGPGPYTGRTSSYPDDPCCPLYCRLWDDCAKQYVGLSAPDCCFAVVHYQGTGSGCQ